MNTTTMQDTQTKPRKEEILDAATRLFAERGYEGASMNDVAERVGMRKASLFYHFATKEALYEAVIGRLIDTLRSALSAVYAGEGSFRERIARAADTVTVVLGGHPYAARLLVREMMSWAPGLRGKLQDSLMGVFDAGTEFVCAGQQAGEFVDGNAKQLILSSAGLHLLPFAVGQFVQRYMGKDVFDPCFIEERRLAVRTQVQDLFVRK
jgi:TetR/AcrR family transcriptional regulator